MHNVHPHQDENMYYLAQAFFYKELGAGRLSIYHPNLVAINATEVFFEADYFQEGKDSITFEFTLLGSGFSASYKATVPQILQANEKEGHNVRFVETIVISKLY